jgi:hypothetical protein
MLYNPDICPACKEVIKYASSTSGKTLNVVVSESYKDFNEIVTEGLGTAAVNIIYSDSLYDKLVHDRGPLKSTEPVIQFYSEKMEFLLKSTFNSPPKKVAGKTDALPSKIKLPQSTKIGSDKQDWILLSNIDGYSIIQWVNKNDTADFTFLKLYDSVSAMPLIEQMGAIKPSIWEDYKLIKSWKKSVQRMFPSFITCEAFSVKNDTSYFVLSILSFKKTGNDKYAQSRNIFMVRYHARKLLDMKEIQDINHKKKGYLHIYNNFYVANNTKMFFLSYLLSEKYHAHPLVIELNEHPDKKYHLAQFSKYKLYPGFKAVLSSTMNVGNYSISDEVLFYNYFNEIYDITTSHSILLSTPYPRVDSSVMALPPAQWPVWQFACIKKQGNYFSLTKLNSEYWLIRYTQHGVEMNRRKVDWPGNQREFPVVGYYNGNFLMLNIKTKEITELPTG